MYNEVKYVSKECHEMETLNRLGEYTVYNDIESASKILENGLI